MSDTKKMLKSPVPLWIALLIAGAVILILWIGLWFTLGKGERHDVLRWSRGGFLQETDAFLKAVNHPYGDKDLWLTGASSLKRSRSHPLLAGSVQGEEQPLDYALPHVSVYSVPNIHPPHAQPTLRELGDKAQARAIDAIERAKGSDSSPWNDLKKALSDEGEPGEKDPFLFDRVLVATVAKGVKWPPGDRMVWTRAFVMPLNFKFAAYTIASTENQTVKVSSVEAVESYKISAGAELAVPGMKDSKFELKPESGSSVKTNFDINTQYEQLGVDIMPSFLRIIRESGAGGDVSGNTKIALSMTTDLEMIKRRAKASSFPVPEIKLVVTDLHLKDTDKEKTIDVLPIVPLPHCALMANIFAVYEQRHIQDGNQFYDESQHQVVFIHDVDELRTVEVMGADDVSPFIWTIQTVPNNQSPASNPNDQNILSARYTANDSNESGSWRQLVFSDYGRAANLAHWVRTNKGQKASGYEFSWNGNDGLVVTKHSADDCGSAAAAPSIQQEAAKANHKL